MADRGDGATNSAPHETIPDERPQRRREYSGAGSTLGLAALIIAAVAFGIWFFELRQDGGGSSTSVPGMGIIDLPDALNPTGKSPAAREGRAAPNFTLPTLDGPALTLSGLRGKTVLVNFWASWCGPCRGETPDLQSLAEKTATAGKFTVIGVNQQEPLDTAASFTSEFGVTYPILLDRDGQVSTGYRIGRGLPVSVLVGPDGVVERIYLGRISEDDLAALVAEYAS